MSGCTGPWVRGGAGTVDEMVEGMADGIVAAAARLCIQLVKEEMRWGR